MATTKTIITIPTPIVNPNKKVEYRYGDQLTGRTFKTLRAYREFATNREKNLLRQKQYDDKERVLNAAYAEVLSAFKTAKSPAEVQAILRAAAEFTGCTKTFIRTLRVDHEPGESFMTLLAGRNNSDWVTELKDFIVEKTKKNLYASYGKTVSRNIYSWQLPVYSGVFPEIEKKDKNWFKLQKNLERAYARELEKINRSTKKQQAENAQEMNRLLGEIELLKSQLEKLRAASIEQMRQAEKTAKESKEFANAKALLDAMWK